MLMNPRHHHIALPSLGIMRIRRLITYVLHTPTLERGLITVKTRKPLWAIFAATIAVANVSIAQATTPPQSPTVDTEILSVSSQSSVSSTAEVKIKANVTQVTYVKIPAAKINQKRCFWASGTWTNTGRRNGSIFRYRETSRAKFCTLKRPITVGGVTFRHVKVAGGKTGSPCRNLAIPPGRPQPKPQLRGQVVDLATLTFSVTFKVTASATAKATATCSNGSASASATGSGSATAYLTIKVRALTRTQATASARLSVTQRLAVEGRAKATASASASARASVNCGGSTPPPPTPKDASGDFGLSGVCGVSNDKVVSTAVNATAGTPTWNGSSVSVKFTAISGHLFANGSATLVVTKSEVNVEDCPVPNRPPTVVVTNNPQHVFSQGVVTVCARGTDPDGDSLSYSFNAVIGSFANPGPHQTDPTQWCARYTAPINTGPTSFTDTITVTVNDGKGHVVSTIGQPFPIVPDQF